MSSSTFTPANVVDMSKERDWPANLGMLDWDSTQIVFTKRTLLEFLKYAGVTVDTNFSSIQKLPPFQEGAHSSGWDRTDIFGNNHADDDALANAPSSDVAPTVSSVPAQENSAPVSTVQENVQDSRPKSRRTTSSVASLWDPPTESDFKPTRRVRERPGGKDHIAEVVKWSLDDASKINNGDGEVRTRAGSRPLGIKGYLNPTP
ncbi:hypothetical protein B0H21DRAFT_760841 [Amylocystis lapponica]|nr:hypothetical protein B0H21DRAFT_760841 [Amylocystis lapponica]